MPVFVEEFFLKFIAPIYVVLILTEVIFSHFSHRKYYTFSDTLTNIGLSSINGLIDLSFRGFYLVVFYYCYEYRLFTWQNPFWYWASLLILQDLCFYFLHYAEHHIRIFWAVHVTHHSSEHFNLTVGFRSSVFEPLFRFIFFLPLIFLGFHGKDVILMYSITQVYGILIHTRYIHKAGLLEYILVTPSHHRVHHASNIQYLDKNMGMVFIFWDKMFGTFQAEENEEPIMFGLTHRISQKNFLYILFHEWGTMIANVNKSGLSWKYRFKYLFGQPGWSHDGSTKTSRELQREKKKNLLPKP